MTPEDDDASDTSEGESGPEQIVVNTFEHLKPSITNLQK